ncbi:27913_t:CDS:1 [Dentiscutata erythropus]|uniref:27913_t:CDS:1 n=1 Tax=Dentiscutata erythropus TaxID=1348616 RepID=A0A9N9I826_9GLOM|nr:27913_t:CDS:1 [Dentiscutata erythropus]
MSFRYFVRYEHYPYIIYNAHINLRHTVYNVMNVTCRHPRREFRTTKRTLLGLDNMKIDPYDPFIVKIRSNPKILSSIKELVQLLQSKGIDLTNGQTPSMMQMARLATDKEVSKKLVVIDTQLREAGIVLDAETAQKFMDLSGSQQVSKNPITSAPPSLDATAESKMISETNTKQSNPDVVTAKPQEAVGFVEKIKHWFGVKK